MDEYLAHLADRNYSPTTVRAYGYDLLGFCRWQARLDERDGRLLAEDEPLEAVTTVVLLGHR